MGTRGSDINQPDTKIELGRELFVRTRVAKQATCATSDHGGISVNVTEHGADFHGVTSGDNLTVQVYEEGILITPNDDE